MSTWCTAQKTLQQSTVARANLACVMLHYVCVCMHVDMAMLLALLVAPCNSG